MGTLIVAGIFVLSELAVSNVGAVAILLVEFRVVSDDEYWTDRSSGDTLGFVGGQQRPPGGCFLPNDNRVVTGHCVN